MRIERLEIINAGDAGIVFACEKEFLPEELRVGHNAEQCTVFYYPERDSIVLNKNNPNYLRFKDLLIEYLNFNDLQRKEFHDLMDPMPITFFSFIDKILRIQRKRAKFRKKNISRMC